MADETERAEQRQASTVPIAEVRSLIHSMRAAELVPLLQSRVDFANLAGLSFDQRRDLYSALGYTRVLKPANYRDRYNRGGIAKTLVEAFPLSTWRGGGEVIEDEDPEVETEFEKAFHELNTRLSIWSTFQKADILAGLGRFAVIVIGGPGSWDAPLERCKAKEIGYLWPYSERDVTVAQRETKDKTSSRFGLPLFYSLKQISVDGQTSATDAKVHWTRVIHIAEGLLDDPIYGTPRLQAVWNLLEDLDKVEGGGSEASWKRIDGGKQFKIDPLLSTTPAQELALQDKLERYTHGLERNMYTRGVEIQDLGSTVSNFGPNVACLIDLISATSRIPQRVFTGSERGELASTSDQSNYDDRVEDRRNDFAEVQFVRQFVDRMIMIGALPEPQQYETRWPDREVGEAERLDNAKKAAGINKEQGEIVITTNEIRDRILGYPPIEEIEGGDELDIRVEDVDASMFRQAARSKIKRIRLLRLTAKGRRELRGKRVN